MKAAAVVIASIALLVAVAACGSDEEVERERARTEEKVTELTAELETLRAELEDAEDCETAFTDLAEQLGTLRAELRVGVSFDEYSDSLREISIAYEQIDFSELGMDCLGDIGVPLEEAFNKYSKAHTVWGDCIEDFSCDIDATDPRRQRLWGQASSEIDKSKEELADLVSDAEGNIQDTEAELEEAEAILAEHSSDD